MEEEPTIAEPIKQKSNILKLVIGFIGVAVIGSTSAIFIPAFAGSSPDPKSLFSVTLWSGILFSLIWKYRNKRKLTGFIVGLFIGLALSFTASFISGYLQAETRSINTAVESSNKGLPKMIDEETQLEKVSINQKTKDYYYHLTLVNFSLSELDASILDDNFKKSIKPFSCKNKALQLFFKEKYSINYIYKDKNKKIIRQYKIKPSDCKI